LATDVLASHSRAL